MRVAVDVVPIRPGGQIGGAQHVICELLKGLGTQYPNDEFILLTAHWNHDYFSEYECFGLKRLCIISDTHDNGRAKTNLFLWVEKLRKKMFRFFSGSKSGSLLRNNGIDILFCPMTAVTYAEPGIPTVSLIHDIQHEYYPQFFSSAEISHRKRFYNDICSKADAIICISEFTKSTFLDKFDYPPENLYVVYNSVHNRIRFPSDDKINKVLKKYGLDKNAYGYYPANFWPHKNHRILLTAFSMFLKKNKESNLKLVFTGALLENNSVINDALVQMGLEDRIAILGYVSDEELECILAGCEFLIFPSLFEGFGIPVAEAMSFGKPVLCSHVTSLPEVAGNAAIYFDPRRPDEIVNAIETILTDSRLKTELIEGGVQQVAKFEPGEMILRYGQILNEMAVRGGGKGFKIEGIYEDGWTGSTVKVITGNCLDHNVLIMMLASNGPLSPVKISISINGTLTSRYSVESGKTTDISIDIPPQPSNIEILVNPTFNPSDSGSPDTRDLGIKVMSAKIVSKLSGKTIENFRTDY